MYFGDFHLFSPTNVLNEQTSKYHIMCNNARCIKVRFRYLYTDPKIFEGSHSKNIQTVDCSIK